MLESKADHLKRPLAEFIRKSESKRQSQFEVIMPSYLFAKYAADDPDLLAEVFLYGNLDVSTIVLDAMFEHETRLMETLSSVVRASIDSRRQSLAAIALIRMTQAQPLSELMCRNLESPSTITDACFIYRELGAGPVDLWTCAKEADASRNSAPEDSKMNFDQAIYGFLMALGEF